MKTEINELDKECNSAHKTAQNGADQDKKTWFYYYCYH